MYYVYELVNLMGTVEYVGSSCKPRHRFKEHKSKPGIGKGKFYRRLDVFLNIVCSFENKKEALDFEIQLQKYWGLKTDNEKRKIPRSLESKLKQSIAQKGKKRKPFSEEHRRKISETLKKILD